MQVNFNNISASKQNFTSIYGTREALNHLQVGLSNASAKESKELLGYIRRLRDIPEDLFLTMESTFFQGERLIGTAKNKIYKEGSIYPSQSSLIKKAAHRLGINKINKKECYSEKLSLSAIINEITNSIKVID